MRIAITHKLSHRTTKGKKHLLAHVKPYDAGQIPIEIDGWFAFHVPAHRSFSHPPWEQGGVEKSTWEIFFKIDEATKPQTETSS